MPTFFAYFADLLASVKNIVFSIGVFEIFEIVILTLLTYFIIRFIRDTRAEQLIKGILVFGVILLVFRSANFKVLKQLSDILLNAGLVAVVVMFQPELRRALERMGRSGAVRRITTIEQSGEQFSVSVMISEVCSACESMSKSVTGALIVIERRTKLGEQIATGTVIDAQPTSMLIRNIFFKNSPLHDGAMIIRGNRVYAAGCFLPKPQNDERIPRELGTRHRAAVGMSEISDSIVIVVSEETGKISLVENGDIKRGIDRADLEKRLSKRLVKVNLKKQPQNNNSPLHAEHQLPKKMPKHKQNKQVISKTADNAAIINPNNNGGDDE
ncbi:MAG: diadenylate cyclase CdaA [Oscillospiraceae bacterium]|jgi:diadenylate cyclase|nr:diadenylate cyclase CdaA [Oscillospiraceae bacterium]